MTDNGKMTNDGYLPCINMRRAEIDGTNRKIVSELASYRTSGGTDYLVGDKLYFTAYGEKTADNNLIEAKNGSIQYREMGIWCYDFTSDSFELVYDRYNDGYSSISLAGYWQGKLYFSCSEIDEDDNIISGYYAIDLESKEVTGVPSGFVDVSGEYLITLENDTLVLHKDSETKIAAEGFDYDSGRSIAIVNGKLFSPKNDYCFDIETGKCRKVSLPKNTEVRAYLDGSYILMGFDFEAQKPLYSKVSEDELIGDEIE